MPTETDLRMRIDGLKLALRRAAGTIQSCHKSISTGVNGEATIALATALQEDGESWQSAVRRSAAELSR